ncbi:hypothetical protein XENORESO_005918, partial [Xenotaenia resolanae]
NFSQLSENMIHYTGCGSSIWLHIAGGEKTCFTALSIPFCHHVAASVYLLDTSMPTSGSRRMPSCSSPSNPGYTLPFAVASTDLINFLTLGLISVISSPEMDMRGIFT